MLLCDNIVHLAKVFRKTDLMRSMEGTPMFEPQARQLEDFAARLKDATRFILDDAVVESACHVVLSRPSSMLEALRLVRVPLPLMWVEWEDEARRTLRQALGIAHENGRPLPTRFGFLVTADPDGLAGTVEFAWKHPADTLFDDLPNATAGRRVRPEEGVNVANRSFTFDFRRLNEPADLPPHAHDSGMMRRWGDRPREIEALRYLDNCGTEQWTPMGKRLMESVAVMLPHVVEQMADACRADVEGEFLQVLSTLILLNARNGTVTRDVEAPARLNKSRVAKGKAPLLSHRVVTMRLSPGEAKESRGGGAGRLSGPRRSHLVMGHYVTRGKTVYWRRAHVRGGKAAGATGPRTIKVVA